MTEKLALNEKVDTKQLQIAKDGLLKWGKLSVPYLMRKLKCSASKANDILKELSYTS